MDVLPSSRLPADLLLEILARCDAATVIRCAATCKPLYRCITDPSFPRLLRAHTGLRPVTCLAGCFLSPSRWLEDDHRVGFTGTRASSSCDAATSSPVAKAILSFVSRDAEHLESFEPVASRGGLVLFRHGTDHPWGRLPERRLWICNPVTGWRRSVPPPAVFDQAHVLLAGDDGENDGRRRSFRLVAVDFTRVRSDGGLEFQTFTSEAEEDTHKQDGAAGGSWGPVIDSPSPAEDIGKVVHPTTAVVLGRVACWLFRARGAYGVLALDVATGRAARIDLPPESALGSGAIPRTRMLLSTTADGRLGLIAGEQTRVSVWALSEMPAAIAAGEGAAAPVERCGWSLRAAYEREWIGGFVPRPLGAGRRKPGFPVIELVWSGGERCGAVFMKVDGFGCYVLLDMQAGEIVRTGVATSLCICPYEVDLALLTSPMKSF